MFESIFCLLLQHQQRADEMSALAQQQPGFDSFNNQSGGGQNTSGDNSAAAENSAADATFNAVAANASNNSGQFENMGYDQVTCKLTVFCCHAMIREILMHKLSTSTHIYLISYLIRTTRTCRTWATVATGFLLAP